jgi:uncharacterized protein
MQFENSFEVDAPLEQVWKTMLDVERVAPLVPGAEVREKTGDDAYKVGIKVKLGPMSMTYRGDVEVVDRDDAAHTANLRIKAKEARGQGTADATARMSLSGDEGHASATITTDVRLSGRAAAMSRGIVDDVARKMIDQFAGNLEQMLAGDGKAEAAPGAEGNGGAPAADKGPTYEAPPPREDALDVGDLAGSIAAERLRNPRAIAGALALVFLIGYLVRRARS